MSHVRGTLRGLFQNSVDCEIYSGCSLPIEEFRVKEIPAQRHPSFFWEAQMLLYNFRFVRSVVEQFPRTPVKAFYQRHGRFVFAGALLSRRTKIPLILEYNGSEAWLDKFWDPGRFRTLLRLCENVSIANASILVVVSEPLRQELLARGIPGERILLNPNGVDPDFFRPGDARRQGRQQLEISDNETLVTFVGTFGPWHGVDILTGAITKLLEDSTSNEQRVGLRFLFVGQGTLLSDVRAKLARYVSEKRVIFTGAVARERVRQHLDASDVLVSPHVPMPDGRPFFGSPTKLFEYMAMGKAIVASRLDQLAEVLEHKETAWLVEPGDIGELANAIELLAGNPELRERLGHRAREVATQSHSWQERARRLLDRLNWSEGPHASETPVCIAIHERPPSAARESRP